MLFAFLDVFKRLIWSSYNWRNRNFQLPPVSKMFDKKVLNVELMPPALKHVLHNLELTCLTNFILSV